MSPFGGFAFYVDHGAKLHLRPCSACLNVPVVFFLEKKEKKKKFYRLGILSVISLCLFCFDFREHLKLHAVKDAEVLNVERFEVCQY